MAACAECKFGKITMHSHGDSCSNPLNVAGLPPYALRHDETLCGSTPAWFEQRAAADAVYKAVDAITDPKPAP